MKVAVVGAGWAGLAAAFELHRRGHHVNVYEAGHTLGGRARRVSSPKLDGVLDNGQHIMLGAYTQTLALMRRLGLDPNTLLYRMPLALKQADGSFALRVPALPGPLALPAALLSAQGASWPERVKMGLLIARLAKSWRTPHGSTVAQWLAQGGQSTRLVRKFWEPLCLAAMNTPVDRACSQLFANVLRDSLGAGPKACEVLIPRVDLSSLWPQRLPQDIAIAQGHTVRRLEVSSSGREVLVDGRHFDAVVVATNVQSARRLLSRLPAVTDSENYLAMLDAFRPVPIATLTLELKHKWDMPHAMLMLADSPPDGRFGQWLFHCNVFMAHAQPTSRLNVVISNASGLADRPVEQVLQGVVAQIHEQLSGYAALPPVLAHELITEKRATFAAVPHLARPRNTTPWQRIYAAGDWTDTGYPAVLEGAVRSGLQAAGLIAGRAA